MQESKLNHNCIIVAVSSSFFLIIFLVLCIPLPVILLSRPDMAPSQSFSNAHTDTRAQMQTDNQWDLRE